MNPSLDQSDKEIAQKISYSDHKHYVLAILAATSRAIIKYCSLNCMQAIGTRVSYGACIAPCMHINGVHCTHTRALLQTLIETIPR